MFLIIKSKIGCLYFFLFVLKMLSGLKKQSICFYLATFFVYLQYLANIACNCVAGVTYNYVVYKFLVE